MPTKAKRNLNANSAAPAKKTFTEAEMKDATLHANARGYVEGLDQGRRKGSQSVLNYLLIHGHISAESAVDAAINGQRCEMPGSRIDDMPF